MYTRRVRGGRKEVETREGGWLGIKRGYKTYWRKIFIEPALNVGHGLAG